MLSLADKNEIKSLNCLELGFNQCKVHCKQIPPNLVWVYLRRVHNNKNIEHPSSPNGNMLLPSEWDTHFLSIYTVIYVLHRPSGVPQFDQVVKRAGDQLVLMWRRPLHSGDPASVGGQRQQHQWAVWWGEEAFRAPKTKSKEKCFHREIKRLRFLWDVTKWSLALRHLWYLEHSGTFGARVPQSDVSVSAAWGQPSTQRRIGNAVKHFTASLWKGQKTSVHHRNRIFSLI